VLLEEPVANRLWSPLIDSREFSSPRGNKMHSSPNHLCQEKVSTTKRESRSRTETVRTK